MPFLKTEWAKECQRKSVTKHGDSQRPEYSAYKQAEFRCTRPQAPNFHAYGGRGIEFRFDSYEQFIECIGYRPSPKHSLDRINNNGHYEPGNVRWATRKEQARNTRSNQIIGWKGLVKSLAEWSEILGISVVTLRRRFGLGWSIERTFTTPPRPYPKLSNKGKEAQ